MDTVTIIVIIAYLLITAALGYLGYKKTKSTSDYLVGGRKVHPVIMAISYGATFISTSAIIGFGGAAANTGMGILWLTFLNIFVGIFLAFVVFGKRIRRLGHKMDAHTFPEFIAKRFDSKFLQVAFGVVIFVGMPIYAGSVMLGGSTYMVQALGISQELAILILVALVSAYVLFGGMKGVMYTDAFQGGLMFVGMIILLIVTYSALGGVTSAHQQLADLPAKLTGPSKALVDAAAKGGFTGWMSMPAAGSPSWIGLISTLVLSVGVGVLAQPQLVVRFMTVKSDRELNRGVAIGGLFIIMMTGVAFITGALSNVWFFNTEGVSAIGKTITAAAPKGVTDAIIPNFIASAMPWFNSIFMVTLLAAAMSTMSSQIHTMGTALGRDVLEKGAGVKMKDGKSVVRLAMLVGIFLSALLAYFLPRIFPGGQAVIAQGTALFFGLCASAFLPLLAFGIFWKGTTKKGATWGFIVGLSLSLIWLLFFYTKVSGAIGLCGAIFGLPALIPSMGSYDPLIIATPLAALTVWIVSLLTPKFEKAHMDSIFAK